MKQLRIIECCAGQQVVSIQVKERSRGRKHQTTADDGGDTRIGPLSKDRKDTWKEAMLGREGEQEP